MVPAIYAARPAAVAGTPVGYVLMVERRLLLLDSFSARTSRHHPLLLILRPIATAMFVSAPAEVVAAVVAIAITVIKAVVLLVGVGVVVVVVVVGVVMVVVLAVAVTATTAARLSIGVARRPRADGGRRRNSDQRRCGENIHAVSCRRGSRRRVVVQGGGGRARCCESHCAPEGGGDRTGTSGAIQADAKQRWGRGQLWR
jgi:hypothetical protein